MELIKKGNDFYIQVNLFDKVNDELVPYDLTVCDYFRAYITGEKECDKYIESNDLVDGTINGILIHVKDLPVGYNYKILVDGSRNGEKFSCNIKNFFAIVKDSDKANVTWETVDGITRVNVEAVTVHLVDSALIVGKNAYELAKEQGYQGTLQDYIEEMVDNGQSAAEARQAAAEATAAKDATVTAINNAVEATENAITATNNAQQATINAQTATSNAVDATTAATAATTAANQATVNANNAATNANQKAQLANEKAQLADSKATLANTAATNANNKATVAQTAADNANQAASRVETAIDNATAATQSANAATQSANAAAQSATTAATNAIEKAQLANEKAQLADSKATLANTAATNANNKATVAQTAADNANSAATIAEEASEVVITYNERIEDLEENKADINGYYDTLGAGTATNLLGSVPIYAGFSHRNAGGDADIASGLAVVDSIKGNTLALYNWFNFKQSDQATSDSNYWTYGSGSGGASLTWNFSTKKITYKVATSTQYNTYFLRNKLKYRTYYNGVTGYGNNGANMPVWYLTYSCRVTAGADTDATALRHIRPEFLNQSAERNLERTIECGKVYHFKEIWKEQYPANSSLPFNFQFNLRNGGNGSTIYKGDVWEVWDLQLVNLTYVYKNAALNVNNLTVEEIYNLFPSLDASYITPTSVITNGYTPINIKASGIKTVGFNQFNVETGKAYLLADNEYQLSGTYTSITKENEELVIDADGKFIPTLNGEVTVVGGDSLTCIHLVWSGKRDGDTEPYWEETKALDVTTVRDADTDEVIFPDGMNGIINAYDEINQIQAIKRIKQITFGDLQNWTPYIAPAEGETTSALWCADLPSDAKLDGEVWSPNFCYSATFDPDNRPTYRQIIAVNNGKVWFWINNLKLTLNNSTYTNCKFYYELAEPEVHNIDIPVLNYKVDDFGTEQMLPATQLGDLPISAPIKCNVIYGINASDAIRRLPTNYISLESMRNILESVGEELDGTFDITWNADNECYTAEFTSNIPSVFDNADVGHYLDADGSIKSSGAWNISDYVEVTEGDILDIYKARYSTATRHCFYDAEQNFISSTSYQTWLQNIAVPSNAAYIRISYGTNGDGMYIYSHLFKKFLLK